MICKRCIMPITRPRIVFDSNGICNACHNADEKLKVDWGARRIEFLDYIDKYRAKSGPYDCIVPWSGGKDSSYIAHRLKFEFGLNPLLVTFSPLVPNEIGQENRERFVQLGFDNILLRPNQRVARKLSQRFFRERGNPKVAWDAGINAVPMQVAVNYNIPLIFYAEHGESEYGGRVLSEESRKIRDFTEVLEHQVGDDPRNWVEEDITENELAPYIYPSSGEIDRVGVKAMYFSYFFKWSMLENYKYIHDIMDFRLAEGKRSDGTFTNFDSLDDKIDNIYYYLQYIKFGFGRATRDACRMIQNGQMSRDEAVNMAETYDREFPKTYFHQNLDYLGLTEPEFNEIVNSHRNNEIWHKVGNDWELMVK